MGNPEYLDEAVAVTAWTGSDGQVTPHNLTWQNRQYQVGAVGRQWDETDGHHVLVEAADGTRFELLLRREDLVWHLRRVWWASTLA